MGSITISAHIIAKVQKSNDMPSANLKPKNIWCNCLAQVGRIESQGTEGKAYKSKGREHGAL